MSAIWIWISKGICEREDDGVNGRCRGYIASKTIDSKKYISSAALSQRGILLIKQLLLIYTSPIVSSCFAYLSRGFNNYNNIKKAIQ